VLFFSIDVVLRLPMSRFLTHPVDNVNQCQSNIYIAPTIEGRIWGAGVWVTRRDMQKRKGEI